MPNKVFLVEDEVVTREGIRDNVDWRAIGYEFCGEAADGETALPLIEETQPDVLITDIRMPFMDGLQLCRIVRERLPGTRVIILSGHDEFEYAQEAVELGVTQYLLKPVGVRALQESLGQVAAEIAKERAEAASLQNLHERLEENLSLLRERFLIRLLAGGMSASEAIEQSSGLQLDIVAKCYLVVALRIETAGDGLDYEGCKQTKDIVASLVHHNSDVLLVEKDLCELVLIVKGNGPSYLEHAGNLLSQLIQNELAEKAVYAVKFGVGEVQTHIGEIPASFSQALAALDNHFSAPESTRTDKAELLKLDRTAISEYLRFGTLEEYDAFNTRFIHPLAVAAQRSQVIKTVTLVDVALTTARFVTELGGDVDAIVPEINRIEQWLQTIDTGEELERHVRQIVVSALEYRDGVANDTYGEVIRRAKSFIADQFANPDLTLSEVASCVNLSPSHFSTVFSRETGQTFKEFLTALRMHEAMALLRSTSLTATEISHRVGYNDSHYFSQVFRRQTGATPSGYRRQSAQT